MSSCAATRRASSTSPTLQQPESDSPPQSLSVTPTTSWPASRSSAAATDESTPPLIATNTFTARPPTRRSCDGHPDPRSRPLGPFGRLRLEALDRGGQDLQHAVDVLVPG